MKELPLNSTRERPLVVDAALSDGSSSSNGSTRKVNPLANKKKTTHRRASLGSTTKTAATPKRCSRRSSLDSSKPRDQQKTKADQAPTARPLPPRGHPTSKKPNNTPNKSKSATKATTTAIIGTSRRSSLDSSINRQRNPGTGASSTIIKQSRRASLDSSSRTRTNSPPKRAPRRHLSNDFVVRLQQEMTRNANKAEVQNPRTCTKKQGKLVRFASSKTFEYHYDARVLDETECQALWYSANETASWKTAMVETVREITNAQLQCRGNSYATWSNCLLRAYNGLQTNLDRNHVARLLACSQTTLSPQVVGLEKWVVKSLCQDRFHKRTLIWKRLQQVQNSKSINAETKSLKIRKLSRAVSRPHRLYSQYVASLAAHEYNELVPSRPVANALPQVD